MYYVAVRRAGYDGHEWVDIETISGCLKGAKEKAKKAYKTAPGWSAENPVVRFSQAELTLIEVAPLGNRGKS